MNMPTASGGSHDAVLIAALREHVFDLEDYDAEAAAAEAARDIPQLGAFLRDVPSIVDFTDLAVRILDYENRALDYGVDPAAVTVRRRRLAARLHNAIDRAADMCRTDAENTNANTWTCPVGHTSIDPPVNILGGGRPYCPTCVRSET